jgi:hypothetical protein
MFNDQAAPEGDHPNVQSRKIPQDALPLIGQAYHGYFFVVLGDER